MNFPSFFVFLIGINNGFPERKGNHYGAYKIQDEPGARKRKKSRKYVHGLCAQILRLVLPIAVRNVGQLNFKTVLQVDRKKIYNRSVCKHWMWSGTHAYGLYWQRTFGCGKSDRDVWRQHTSTLSPAEFPYVYRPRNKSPFPLIAKRFMLECRRNTN